MLTLSKRLVSPRIVTCGKTVADPTAAPATAADAHVRGPVASRSMATRSATRVQNTLMYFVTSIGPDRILVVTEKSMNFWNSALSFAVKSLEDTYLIIGTVSTTSAGVNVLLSRCLRASSG